MSIIPARCSVNSSSRPAVRIQLHRVLTCQDASLFRHRRILASSPPPPCLLTAACPRAALCRHLLQNEVVSILQQQAKIEPSFTQLVWQKLEEQNLEFFR